MAAGEAHRAASGGGGAVPGDDDADEVGGVGGGNRHCCGSLLLFARFAQRFDSLGERELLALKAGDKAAAAHDTACFEAAEHAEEFAPAGHGGFALDEVAEDD